MKNLSGTSSSVTKKAADAAKVRGENQKQKTITSFFTTTSRTANTRQEAGDDNDIDVPLQEAIPVTGYGVWVSEIMCQQTRVEAVIPYWIRCKSLWVEVG